MKPDSTQSILDKYRNQLNGVLVSCDVFLSLDGTSIAGIKSNRAACAILTELTMYILDSLESASLSPFKDYYIVDLENDEFLIIVKLGDEYLLSCILHSSQADRENVTNMILNDLKQELDSALY